MNQHNLGKIITFPALLLIIALGTSFRIWWPIYWALPKVSIVLGFAGVLFCTMPITLILSSTLAMYGVSIEYRRSLYSW